MRLIERFHERLVERRLEWNISNLVLIGSTALLILLTSCSHQNSVERFSIKPATRVITAENVAFEIQFEKIESAGLKPRVYWRSSSGAVLAIDDTGGAHFLSPGKAEICARVAYFYRTSPDSMLQSGSNKERCEKRIYRPSQ